MDKVKTYIENLDDILHGGIPECSLISITGEPGAGKTVLTLQIMANNAARGAKCLYLTTLSEPANKVIGYVEDFQFFDKNLIEDRFLFRDIGNVLRSEGPVKATEEILRLVEEEKPDILAIDSFRAMRDLARTPEEARSFIYELAVHLSVWCVTTFLVSVYEEEERQRNPEFTIVDGIIYLSYELEDLRAVRKLRVRKLRRSTFNEGLHFFEINVDGIHAYPRVGSVVEGTRVESEKRMSTGLSGLDEMLGGGLLENSSTLVEGATGVGKTILGLHFLAQGTKQGEAGILFTFEERPDQIHAVAKSVGLGFAVEDGIRIEHTDPVDLLPAKWLDRARAIIEETGAKRIVIDSLSSLRAGSVGERPFHDLLYTALKMFRVMGVTVLMTVELTDVLATNILSGQGVSWSADNIIIMRYVEVESELRRTIGVLKTRSTNHENTLREFNITDKGMIVSGPFKK